VAKSNYTWKVATPLGKYSTYLESGQGNRPTHHTPNEKKHDKRQSQNPYEFGSAKKIGFGSTFLLSLLMQSTHTSWHNNQHRAQHLLLNSSELKRREEKRRV
jgi:hypothetical protein